MRHRAEITWVRHVLARQVSSKAGLVAIAERANERVNPIANGERGGLAQGRDHVPLAPNSRVIAATAAPKPEPAVATANGEATPLALDLIPMEETSFVIPNSQDHVPTEGSDASRDARPV